MLADCEFVGFIFLCPFIHYFVLLFIKIVTNHNEIYIPFHLFYENKPKLR